MSRKDGILRVALTGKWFGWDAGYWTPRECYDFHPYHTLVASRGYTSRILTRKIKRIRWGTPRLEWSGDTVRGNCFVIELEDA